MIKPMGRIPGMNTMPEAVLNKKPRGQKVTTTPTPREPISQLGSIVPHSAAQARRTKEYHKNIRATHTGGRQSSARITDQLNPDSSVSLDARTQGRRFPGLAN